MSSRLPAALLEEFDQRYRLPDGRYRCEHCRKKVGKGQMHRDHRKREADHPELTYDIDNLQPLCVPCHKVKTSAENARARTRRAMAPLRTRLIHVGIGLAVLWAGVVALGYAVAPLLGLDPANWLEAHRTAALWAAGAVVALLAALKWWSAGGDGQAKPTRQGPDEAARLEARIVAEAREVVGPRGEVKVSRMEWR